MVEIVLCGRGGQGIVFLTRQIGQILSQKGLDVISSETHGMAVRGGSINSHLRIGGFLSPLVRNSHADFLLSLDSSETRNNIHFLKPNGVVLQNSQAEPRPGVIQVDATGIARQLRNVQSENVVLLGFASTLDNFPVNSDDLRSHFSKERRPMVRDLNMSALEAGVESGRNL